MVDAVEGCRPGRGASADAGWIAADTRRCPSTPTCRWTRQASDDGKLAEPDLNVALDHLVRAGLLSRRGVPPDATYLFKHALLQDLAHGALLREPRRVLHMRIAQALEAHFPDVAQSQPQVLRATARRQDYLRKLRRSGEEPDGSQWSVQRWWRRNFNFRKRSPRSPSCRARRRFAANKSNSKRD